MVGGANAREEFTDGGKNHAGFTQFWKDARDVVKEGGIRPYDEHARGRQLLAMGVEEISHAVQSYCGLARAGTTFDHEYAPGVIADDLDILVHEHGLGAGWHEVVTEADGAEPITSEVLIVSEDSPLGVVSDIDDTVMVTWLPRAMTAAWNSWVKRTNSRQPVEGMARFYQQLQEQHPEMPFIYLSTGAWNTYDTLVSFMEHNGFPRGPLLLTDWGPTPTGLFRNGQEHKRVQLRNLFIAFPWMKWLLIGDDGQHDPLTYGDAANEHPDRVAAVAIRNLSPQEQLLSHGSLGPLADANEEGSFSIPLIQGGSGSELAAQMHKISAELEAEAFAKDAAETDDVE